MAEDHGALDDVLQLTDIAGIGVPLKNGARIRIDVVDLLPEFPSVMDQGAHREGQDILNPLPERRQLECDDVEPEVQVFTKCSPCDLFFEIAIGRGDQAKIHRDIFRSSDSSKGAFLQNAKQLPLHPQIEIADLVQEQRAALGAIQKAKLALMGACKRAAFMSEQLAFKQVAGNGRAVDADEGR